MSATSPTRNAIEAVWRVEAARLIGGLVRVVGDVDRAEDLAHEALVTALERWPETGIPDNPGAWLATTAKHRALDELRRRKMQERKHQALGDEPAPGDDDDVGDDLLRLVLIACHPVLSPEARVALTLRLVCGLGTDEIARATLLAEATVAQRIVRAKRTLSEARVPYEVPSGDALGERLSSVLEVVYLIFNEGWSATRGDDLMRPRLVDDALRIGRILTGLVPRDAEVWGLLALMELSASRARTRVDAAGDLVLLFDQDRARWDRLLIERGLSALERSASLCRPLGAYALQAAISACHARARTPQETDWPGIVALYDALVELTQSPVVALNRAVAVSYAFGPAAGLELLDELADEPALAGYPYLAAARGDVLERLGRREEARRELLRAAASMTNERERALLKRRADAS